MPERVIAWVSATRSSSVMPRKIDRHGEGGGLRPRLTAPLGQTGDEVADLARAQRLAVALGANDFLGKNHAGCGR